MKRALILTLLSLLISVFTLTAQDSLYTNFKFSPYHAYKVDVKAGGDLNGDGYDDLVIANRDSSKAHIYFGGADFDTIPDLTINSGSVKIAYNGDLNGDGYDDLVTSVPGWYDWNNQYGIVYIYFGSSNFDLDVDVTLIGYDYAHGNSVDDFRFGSEIDISADYNNDGFNDLTVFSPGYAGLGYGFINVFNGGSDFDQQDDLFIEGEYGSYLGTQNSVGDVNGDGFDDLAVTYLQYNPQPSHSFVHVYPGGTEGLGDEIASSIPRPDELHSDTNFRIDISGDFNGDGYNDITMYDYGENPIIIAYGNSNYEFEEYQSWIFNESVFILSGVDMDIDGYDDLIVRSMSESKIEIFTGRSTSLVQIPTYSIEKSSYLYFSRLFYNIGNITNSSYPSILIGEQKDDQSEYNLTCLTLQDLETSIVENNNYELEIKNYSLKQNCPNPFNPITKIKYELRSSNYKLAKIVIYNSIGQQVWSSPITDHTLPITGSIVFDGSKFDSGIYYYSLIVDGKKLKTKKMILIK